jgi:hypothetical protein
MRFLLRQLAAVCLAHQKPASGGVPGLWRRLLALHSRHMLIGSIGLATLCSCGVCGWQMECAEEHLSAQEPYGMMAGPG